MPSVGEYQFNDLELQHFMPELAPPVCDILDQIDHFRGEMMSLPLTVGTKLYRYVEKRTSGTKVYNEPETQIALGLLNLQSCTRRIVTVTKRGDKLIAPSGYRIDAVKRANGIRWNYYNTIYQVTEPAGWFVAANVYPIEETHPVAQTVRLKSGKLVQRTVQVKQAVPVFYVTFSSELDRPEFVALGKRYLLDLATRALDRLRERNVMSHAFPKTPVADTLIARPDWLSRIAPIEHTDMGEFALDPTWAFDRAFVQIGLNRSDFATYTCSRAAACGLMQITDNEAKVNGQVKFGTYTTLRLAYPDAGLIPDFLAGARDPVNAMMLAYIHNDDILAKLITEFGPTITDDLQQLEELIFAGYNSGNGYLADAVRAKERKKLDDWTVALPRCRYRGQKRCIPAETRDYVAGKLRYLQAQWDAFGVLTALKP